MIVGALVALQIAAVARPLVIRDADHAVRVPTVASSAGPMVSAVRLGAVLPLRVHHDSASYYTLDVWGARMQLQPGVPVVRVGDDVRQLAAAPVTRDGTLLLPLQMISDVFPTVVPNTRWDADSGQLVIFASGIAASAVAQSSGEVAPAPRPSRRVSRASDDELPPVPAKTGRRLVIVDAGHGGVDNGMSGPIGGGPKIYEKNITLQVAMKLGEQLRARGLDVAYTRTTDTLIALDDRGRIANRDGGDLFISIHVNAANPNWKDPGAARGFETYFLSEAHTEDARRVEQMENSAARYETGGDKPDVGDPLSFIVNDMKQNEHLRESSELADLIEQRLGPVEPGPDRGVKQAGFRVLVTAYMPAVLVEIGFGTNPRDAAFIANPDRQRALASAIADAAVEYLQRYERRVTAGATGDRQR
ncbi:MAG TPA: N-acetylmuramoyl-L-alanine amidase [Gemmatimonadaceae bacterium]|nr:N-acetylmuramoyl-L-alanine amidase [Gemmatimonadaceae bacterium]